MIFFTRISRYYRKTRVRKKPCSDTFFLSESYKHHEELWENFTLKDTQINTNKNKPYKNLNAEELRWRFTSAIILETNLQNQILNSFMENFGFLYFRSSRTQMSLKIDVVKHFANITRKHLCWSLILIKMHVISSLQLY